MTLDGIEGLLKTRGFLVFLYCGKCYSLQMLKQNSGYVYRFIDANCSPTQDDSLENLVAHSCLDNGIILRACLNDIFIPSWNSPIWETYQAIRHCVIVYHQEVHFFFHDRSYWICFPSSGHACLNDDSGFQQEFDSATMLFEHARIEGQGLEKIWRYVSVDSC